MEMIPVESSNLASVGYNADTATLRIDFKNGYGYEYFDVPQYIYDELMAAESKGSYAANNIYKNYTQQRIA